jgi:hypothetical protein
MGAIIPMPPLKIRRGFVRKREKKARREAQAQPQALRKTQRIEPLRALKVVASNSAEGDDR